MSLSKDHKNTVLRLNKKVLLDLLWEKGSRPGDSDFEVIVKHQIYLVLGLREATCSNQTNDDIAHEASKFRKSVQGYWKKIGSHKDILEKKPFFLKDIVVEVVPLSQEIPELAPSTSAGGRKPGPIKPFEEKGPRAQAYMVADVHAQHPPEAVLRAAPKSASQLGLPKTATAIRKMAKDPEVNAGLALDGMKDESKQSLCNHLQYILCIIHYHYK